MFFKYRSAISFTLLIKMASIRQCHDQNCLKNIALLVLRRVNCSVRR